MRSPIVVTLVGLVGLAACGPASEPATVGKPPAAPATCRSLAPKIEQLYRADAQQHDPKRVDEAVADNTEMVMNDCEKQPARAVPCLQAAATVADLEHRCLIPLDPEGSEGEALAR